MDMLLSLPVLSYFFMPSMASYSTSLNLMFFYMTWSTLVLSQSPLKVEIIGTLASYVLFFIVPASLFLLFDTILPSLAVGIKIQGGEALPTRTGGVRVSGRRKDRPQWYGVIGFSMLNICLSMACQAGLELLFVNVLHLGSVLKVTTTLPMPWTIAREVAQMLVAREILQYAIHRYFLHPNQKTRIGKLHFQNGHINKLHQKYAHSIKAPWSYTAHYDHPLPYFFDHIIPLYLPVVILRPHVLTHLLQLSLTTLASTLIHSGYSTIPGIILGGATRRCDQHYSSGGAGNFSSSGILDWIMGSGIGADVMDDVRDEAQKHQVQQRSGRALRGLKDSGKEGIRSARRKSGRN